MTNVVVCTILTILLLVILFPGFMQGAYVGGGTGRGDSEIYAAESETTDQPGWLEWESCNGGGFNCFERPLRQLEAGPFWANRGKRQPVYRRDRLFVDEPQWLLGRRSSALGSDDDPSYLSGFDPFFPTRGKKQKARNDHTGIMRDRRDPGTAGESPFFAARGKKSDNSLVPE